MKAFSCLFIAMLIVLSYGCQNEIEHPTEIESQDNYIQESLSEINHLIVLNSDNEIYAHIENIDIIEIRSCLSKEQINELLNNKALILTESYEIKMINEMFMPDMNLTIDDNVITILTVDASWGCIKGCSSISDPIARAECLKSCTDKVPNQL